jgi:hypothetical protein
VDATGAEYVSIAAGCFDNANPALTPGLLPRMIICSTVSA